MDIYYNCPCCNKKQQIIQPLTMGSAWKDEMYKCLGEYLKTLQAFVIQHWEPKKPKLFLSLDSFEGEQQKIPKSLQLVYVPPKERGEKKAKKKIEDIKEQLETSDPSWRLWASLAPEFKVGNVEYGEAITEAIVKLRIGQWTELGLSRKQCKDWMTVGFEWDEAQVVAFCVDILGYEPEEILNFQSKEEVIKEFNKAKGIEEDENMSDRDDDEDRE